MARLSGGVPSDDAAHQTRGTNESSGHRTVSLSQEHAPEQGVEDAESVTTTSKQPAPMLHVHAPHDTSHSWRAILIQVGVITIGLLMALLLEQFVEYVHHRNQVAEMRVRLRQETARNVEVIQFDIASVATALKSVDAAARALPSNDDATNLVWRGGSLLEPHTFVPEDAAWLMMRDSGLLRMVPASLAQDYWKIETTHEYVLEIETDARRSLIHLRATLSGAAEGPLGTENGQRLREAFTEYTETLKTFDAGLKSLGTQYNRVLAGQSLYFKDVLPELDRERAKP